MLSSTGETINFYCIKYRCKRVLRPTSAKCFVIWLFACFISWSMCNAEKPADFSKCSSRTRILHLGFFPHTASTCESLPSWAVRSWFKKVLHRYSDIIRLHFGHLIHNNFHQFQAPFYPDVFHWCSTCNKCKKHQLVNSASMCHKGDGRNIS